MDDLEAYNEHLKMLKSRVRIERGEQPQPQGQTPLSQPEGGSVTSASASGTEIYSRSASEQSRASSSAGSMGAQPTAAALNQFTRPSTTARSASGGSSGIPGSGSGPGPAIGGLPFAAAGASGTPNYNPSPAAVAHQQQTTGTAPSYRSASASSVGSDFAVAPGSFLAEKKALLEVIESSATEMEKLRRSNAEIEMQRQAARGELERMKATHKKGSNNSRRLSNSSPSAVIPTPKETVTGSTTGSETVAAAGGGFATPVGMVSTPGAANTAAAVADDQLEPEGLGDTSSGATPPQQRNLLGKYQKIVAEVETLSSSVVQLQREKAELESAHAAKVRTLRAQVEQLQRQMEEEQKKNQETTVELGMLTEEHKRSQADLTQGREENTKQSLELNELHTSLDQLAKQIQEREEVVATLRDEAKQREDLITYQDTTLNELDIQLGAATAAAAEWERRFHEVEAHQRIQANDRTVKDEEMLESFGLVVQSLQTIVESEPADPLAIASDDEKESTIGEALITCKRNLLSVLESVRIVQQKTATKPKQNDKMRKEGDEEAAKQQHAGNQHTTQHLFEKVLPVQEEPLTTTVRTLVDTRLERLRSDTLQKDLLAEMKNQTAELLQELEATRGSRNEFEYQCEKQEAELVHEKASVAALREQLQETMTGQVQARIENRDDLELTTVRLEETEEKLSEALLDCRRLSSRNEELQSTVDSLQVSLQSREEDHEAILGELNRKVGYLEAKRRQHPQPDPVHGGASTGSSSVRAPPEGGGGGEGGLAPSSPTKDMQRMREECERLRAELRRQKLLVVEARHSTAHTSTADADSSILGMTELSPSADSSPGGGVGAGDVRYNGHSADTTGDVAPHDASHVALESVLSSIGVQEQQQFEPSLELQRKREEEMRGLKHELKQMRLERDMALERSETKAQTVAEEKEVTVAALKRQLFLIQKENRAREARQSMLEKELHKAKGVIAEQEDALHQHREILDYLSSQGHAPSAAAAAVRHGTARQR